MTSERREHLKKLQRQYLEAQRRTRRGKYTQMLQWQEQVRKEYPEAEYDVTFKEGKAEVALKPEVAEAQWKQQIMQQYPAAYYQVVFVGGQAQITPRRVPSEGKPTAAPLKGPRLEAEALAARPMVQRGTRTQPQYQAVSKRYGSLAEYDIPYTIKDMASSIASARQEVREKYPSDKYQIEFLSDRAIISSLPEVAAPQLFKEHYETVIAPKKMESQYLRETMRSIEAEKTARYKGPITPLQLKQKELHLETFLGPQLISLREAKVKRLSEELYARGDPFGYFAAGFVSAGETTVELVFPHPTGVSPVFHDIFALPGQPPEFIVGRVAGEVITAVTVGKIFEGPLTLASEAASKVVGKVVPKTIQTYVAKAGTTIKAKLPSFKGSRIDVWLAKHSEWYYRKTGGLAVQEVVQPAGIRVFDMGTGKVVEKVGTGYLTSSELSWALAATKRTSAISVSKTFIEPATPSMKHLFFRGGKLTVGYLSELGFKKTAVEMVAEQRTLTPLVTQTQITRMGIVPYVGGKVTTIGSAFFRSTTAMFALSLAPKVTKPTPKLRLEPKLKPIQWEPTLTREVLRFRMLSLEKQEVKQRQLLALPKLKMRQLQHQPTRELLRPKLEKKQVLPLPSLALPKVATVQQQEQKLLTTPKLRQTAKHVYPPKLVPPTPTLSPPIKPFTPPFGGQDFARDIARLSGRWFKRTHAIKEPEQMLRTFRAGPRKRLKRSRQRKGGGLSWF